MLGGTMGNSPAGLNLEQILNGLKNKKFIHVVTDIYHKYCYRMNVLDGIPDAAFREHIADMCRNHTLKIVDSRGDLPDHVRSHLRNILIGVYRTHLESWKNRGEDNVTSKTP